MDIHGIFPSFCTQEYCHIVRSLNIYGVMESFAGDVVFSSQRVDQKLGYDKSPTYNWRMTTEIFELPRGS